MGRLGECMRAGRHQHGYFLSGKARTERCHDLLKDTQLVAVLRLEESLACLKLMLPKRLEPIRGSYELDTESITAKPGQMLDTDLLNLGDRLVYVHFLNLFKTF